MPPELRGRILRISLWGGAVMASIGALSYGMQVLQSASGGWFLLAGWLILLASWWIGERGYLPVASHVLIWAFWLLINLLILSEFQHASLWLLPQFFVVLLARYLLSGRVALALAVLTGIFDIGLYWLALSRLDLADLENHTPDSHTLPIAISIVFIFLLFRVTDLVHREIAQMANASMGRYRSLFEFTNDGVFLINKDSNYVEVNQPAADLLGLTREQVKNTSIYDVIPRDEAQDVRDNFEQLKNADSLPLFERTFIRPDGSRRTAEVSISVVRDPSGKFQFYQSVTRDVTERKRLEQELRISLKKMETLAMQDALTGLLNRRAITEHAEAEWHRSRRERRPMCIALIDLDNLKEVNDTFGHLVGDQVISKLGEVIKASLRRYDWAGRWGGDEFLLVLPGANLVEAQNITERIRDAYVNSELVSSLDCEFDPFLSVGIAVYSGRPGDDSDSGDLFGMADKALYTAKEGGKNRIEIYRDPVAR